MTVNALNQVSTKPSLKLTLERPIFIVGSARSGTTLLRFMLSQHPRIYIPPQSGFIPLLFNKRPCIPMSRQEAVHKFNKIFKSRPFIKHWNAEHPHAEDFLTGLPDFTPAVLLNAIYSQYAQRHGAVRWGDKTPTYTGYMDLIAKIFSNAQFIHIVRDGRDVALSLMKTYQSKFYVDIYYATVTWRYYVRKALTSAKNLGTDQYLEVRYEQLTADPEVQLKKICDFLGEKYVPAMSRPNELASRTVSANNIHAETRQPVTTKRIGNWKRKMSSEDLRLFQAVAGDLLDELGYGLVDAGELSLDERVRLTALQTKYNFLKMGRRILQALGVLDPH